MFQTAKQTKVFQDVVEQIQQAILDGRLKTGDILPAERELKAMFNISRGTLREALRVLEQKGLIEIKLGIGGGSVVKAVDTEQISESLGLLIRSQKVSLNHLAEFREDVEGIVAAHAAVRSTQGDIQKLKLLLDQAQTCVKQGSSQRNAFIEIDKQIHMRLADITGNPIYTSVLHSIHDNIHRYYDKFLSMENRELQENYQDLCDLIQAVENGNVDLARKIAQRHVKRFNQYMKKREREEKVPKV
ncbi:MAG: FadR family transcriptional regulator [Desulfobacterales bacterium]|nr:MAG: FadR family transcriptional regulator [Desulfobacterales bacterium]